MNHFSELIIARFGGSPRYWRLQKLWRQSWFGAIRRSFGLREFLARSKKDASGLRYLGARMILPAGLGALSVLALHYLEPVWPRVVADAGLSNTDFGRAITRPISANAYSILLQSVAAVTGVFLALYFASLNTVAATVYTTVPHDIRALIVRDRLGNVYVRVVAYLTTLAVFLLVIQAAGAAPYHLALPIIALTSAFAIFSFIKLGERAFYLADPTLLVDLPATDFRRWAVNATTRGWRWSDPNLQDHYRQLATASLETIRSLLRISTSQRHLQGAPELRLIRALCVSVSGYLTIKRTIPSESRWFGQRFSHKQWFLTESTEIDMATETETQLSPAMIPDVGWVEREMLDAVLETLASDHKDGRYNDIYSTVTYLANIWEQFGVNWQAAEGLDGIDRLTAFLLDAATSSDGAVDNRVKSQLLGAIDRLACMPFAVEVGLYKSVTALAPAQLHSRLAAADWSDGASPYLFGLPTNAVKTLESLYEGIQFESAAATPVHTPGWYVAELAINSLAWEIQKEFDACLTRMADWYPAVADRLTEAGEHEMAGAVLARGLEAAWKLRRHINDLGRVTTELSSRAVLKDLPRPQWDWEDRARRIENFRRQILTRLAASIPHLLIEAEATADDLPDYLGQAVHRSGEACFEALADGNVELFNDIFRPYFLGVFAIVERLRPLVADWTDVRTAVTWMTEPVMDLVDLSGYALIFAEYYERPELWSPCRDIWTQFLQDEANGTQRLQLLSAACAHHQHLFAISPRSVLRTRRGMHLSKMLEALPRDTTENLFHEGTVRHTSALIRKISPSSMGMGMMYLDAVDVFVARFVLKLDNAVDLDCGIADAKLADLNELDDEDRQS